MVNLNPSVCIYIQLAADPFLQRGRTSEFLQEGGSAIQECIVADIFLFYPAGIHTACAVHTLPAASHSFMVEPVAPGQIQSVPRPVWVWPHLVEGHWVVMEANSCHAAVSVYSLLPGSRLSPVSAGRELPEACPTVVQL